MSEDFQDKTEEPTAKKLSDARKKGQVARSQDLVAALMLGCGVIVIALFARYIFKSLAFLMVGVFNRLYEPYSSYESLIFWVNAGIKYIVMSVLPLFLIFVALAFIVNVFQVGIMVSFESLTPKMKKLNIFDSSNYKKFFDTQVLMRSFFGISKLLVIGSITYFVIMSAVPEVSNYINAEPYEVLKYVATEALYVGLLVFLVLLILGIVDTVYQRWKFKKDMKMTKQEVKDERRQAEGDVQVKSRLRSMMQSFVQSRMRTNVPESDVVITNPTHFAIAIKYDVEKMAAPKCVAKGARHMALVIKDIARSNKILIVEDPLLARSLYKVVEVGELIPPEFYHPVAEVLACVYRCNKKLNERKDASSVASGVDLPV